MSGSGVFDGRRARRRDAAPRLARTLVALIALMIAFALSWASLTDIQELARAAGRIAPLGELRPVEHLEGGILAELHVAEGDAVEAGDPIARLASETLDVERARLETREARLAGDRLRLRALLAEAAADGDGEPPAASARAPASVTGSIAAAAAETLRAVASASAGAGAAVIDPATPPAVPAPTAAWGEAAPPPVLPPPGSPARILHDAQRDAYRALRGAHQARLADASEALRLARIRRASLKDRLAVMQERQEISRRLVDRGLARRTLHLAQEAELAEMRGDALAADAAVHAAVAEQDQARRALHEHRLAARQGWLAELAEIEEALALAREALDGNAARAARLVLRAPVSGVVQSLRLREPGEVLEPGGSVAEILPDGLPLVAEIRLSPSDIGHVEIGDPVRLRFTTFDEKSFGVMQGEVARIAATSDEDARGERHFRVAVALPGDRIGEGARRRPIRAGMEVQAEIATATRSIMAWLLKPVRRTLDDAFGER